MLLQTHLPPLARSPPLVGEVAGAGEVLLPFWVLLEQGEVDLQAPQASMNGPWSLGWTLGWECPAGASLVSWALFVHAPPVPCS